MTVDSVPTLTRESRRAAALRENLLKRKNQLKERAEESKEQKDTN